MKSSRPYFDSLRNACRAAIRHGNELADIKPAKWAETFCCRTEDVRVCWEQILTELSLSPVGYDAEAE